MTVNFRCEKCGKLLSVAADPGGSVQCPHCGKRLKVPGALASLPHPQVPPNAQESQSPPSLPGDNQADQEEIPEEPRSDATMTLMADLMPWVLSVLFHLGLALIMAFFIVFSQRTELNVTVPDSVLAIETNAMLNVGDTDRNVNDLAKKNDPERNYSKRESSIKADKGKTAKRVRLIGRGVSSGTSNMFGGMSTGAGAVPSFLGKIGSSTRLYAVRRELSERPPMDTASIPTIFRVQLSDVSDVRRTHTVSTAMGGPDGAYPGHGRRSQYPTRIETDARAGGA